MWESLREARYLHWAGHPLDRIEGSGFSLDIGIHSEDRLSDLMIIGDTSKEGLIVEPIRSDSLDR